MYHIMLTPSCSEGRSGAIHQSNTTGCVPDPDIREGLAQVELPPCSSAANLDSQQAHPERMGASVFGSNQVYSKLKEFKARLPRTPSGVL
jgi:hypothetical protein